MGTERPRRTLEIAVVASAVLALVAFGAFRLTHPPTLSGTSRSCVDRALDGSLPPDCLSPEEAAALGTSPAHLTDVYRQFVYPRLNQYGVRTTDAVEMNHHSAGEVSIHFNVANEDKRFGFTMWTQDGRPRVAFRDLLQFVWFLDEARSEGAWNNHSRIRGFWLGVQKDAKPLEGMGIPGLADGKRLTPWPELLRRSQIALTRGPAAPQS